MDWMKMIKESGFLNLNTESLAKFAFLQVKRKLIEDVKSELCRDENIERAMSKALDRYQDFLVGLAKSAFEKKEEK